MKNIAIRRIKNTDKHRDGVNKNFIQPPDLIAEVEDTTLYPEFHHKESVGWEIYSEEDLLVELAKSSNLLKNWDKRRDDLIKLLEEAHNNIQAKELMLNKQQLREFEEFKRWKESKLAQAKIDRG